ncbi:MAG: hypothetical protein H0W48_00260 [Methylibium sp.]|nr:hypothetical protein [Methylibium sp.]
MNAIPDFGDTLPGVYDSGESLSLTTHRVTVMEPPAESLNVPFAALLAFAAVEAAAIGWFVIKWVSA